MLSPQVSGITQDILYRVGDYNAQTYTSGQVAYLMFANINDLNGRMDSTFSGTFNDGDVTPAITGTVYLPILELLTAKNLIGNSLFSAANTFTLTSFQEGDSKVTVSDKSKILTSLYEALSKELIEAIAQTKFTLASSSPATIIGIDGGISEQIGFRNYDVYRPNT